MKRKHVVLFVHVTAPAGFSVADVRREVRTLINDQCNYLAEPGDVKVRKITSHVSWKT